MLNDASCAELCPGSSPARTSSVSSSSRRRWRREAWSPRSRSARSVRVRLLPPVHSSQTSSSYVRSRWPRWGRDRQEGHAIHRRARLHTGGRRPNLHHRLRRHGHRAHNKRLRSGPPFYHRPDLPERSLAPKPCMCVLVREVMSVLMERTERRARMRRIHGQHLRLRVLRGS